MWPGVSPHATLQPSCKVSVCWEPITAGSGLLSAVCMFVCSPTGPAGGSSFALALGAIKVDCRSKE